MGTAVIGALSFAAIGVLVLAWPFLRFMAGAARRYFDSV